MKAYSKDLREKIVDAIGRGMPKAQAARTFGVGISTVKRYASLRPKGESPWSQVRHPANDLLRWMSDSGSSSKGT
jgi:transposase